MPEPVFHGPRVGRQVISGQMALAGRSPGPGFIVKVGGAETFGAYSVFESTMAAGDAGPQPHIHAAEEAWYVLERALKFRIGEREFIAEAGSFVLVPRGILHSFSNASDQPAKHLTIFSPPRDALWQKVTEMREAAGDEPVDAEMVAALYSEYDELGALARNV